MDLNQIKQLREKTGASVIECKKALEEAGDNEQKAGKILEKKGIERAAKRSDRDAKQGLVETYVHNNRMGVILELNCETDFVARNKQFKELAHDLAMQIAALAPKDKKELLSQLFIKDESKSISDLITENIAKLGENVKIGKFYRVEIN